MITYDTEVPAPSLNSNGFEQCDGAVAYHDYSLPRNATTTRQKSNKMQYDNPYKQNKFPTEIEGTSHWTISRNGDGISTKIHCKPRNYDVPKDTLNNKVIKSLNQTTTTPLSPTKQPLLHRHSGSHKGVPRSPPPTIVLSPPEETSHEKPKIIFEYDNEKYMTKLTNDNMERPNFLVRHKKSIMIIAIVLLLLLLVIVVVLIIYAVQQRD